MGERLRVAIATIISLCFEKESCTRCAVPSSWKSLAKLDRRRMPSASQPEVLPDIMPLDVGMPSGGIEAARSIARACPT